MFELLAETPKDQELINRPWKEYQKLKDDNERLKRGIDIYTQKLRKKSFIRDIPALITRMELHPA